MGIREKRFDLKKGVSIGVLLAVLVAPISYVSAHVGNGCGDAAHQEQLEYITGLLGSTASNAFQAACRDQHDQCYKHGAATYCESRSDCDLRFGALLTDVCSAHFSIIDPRRAVCLVEAISFTSYVIDNSEPFFSKDPICAKYKDNPNEASCDRSEVIVNPGASVCSTNDVGSPTGVTNAELRTGTTSNPFATVEEALNGSGEPENSVADGGVVLVKPGIYSQTFTTSKEAEVKPNGSGSVTLGN